MADDTAPQPPKQRYPLLDLLNWYKPPTYTTPHLHPQPSQGVTATQTAQTEYYTKTPPRPPRRENDTDSLCSHQQSTCSTTASQTYPWTLDRKGSPLTITITSDGTRVEIRLRQ
uniref:E1^E4 n=1 Tax=Human papillomavirus type 32 TaxID=333763 RepID=A0A0U3A9Q3_HPV32|nr:E1^E4 [Human papillomavirus type 32]